jgi:catechol 2,3-dioxygenase-like lactoylglutathione lyase family enzyme
MQITKIHHVAYRCKDAKETVEWYVKHLNMKFVLAIAEDQVPSTRRADPYMHLFMDAGQGNVLAFFEMPELAADGARREHAGMGAAHLPLRWTA